MKKFLREVGEPGMDHLTDDILLVSICKMPSEFDSHELICGLMRKYPREYTKELYKFIRTRDPIRVLHSNIAKKIIQRKFNLRKIGKVSTRNIRSFHTPNQRWKKL